MRIIAIILLIIGIQAGASTIEVIGPCSDTPSFVSENIRHEQIVTLGDFTVQVFEKEKVPYGGSREGIAMIFNSPTGDDAIEILSDEEARFYGWCVHVDGLEPGEMPDQVILKNPDSKIVWFYAYATSLRNKWTEFCVPSYEKKTLKICR